jgi:hypothetical protein
MAQGQRGRVGFTASLQEVLRAHIASTKALGKLRKRRRGDNIVIQTMAAADRVVRAKK